MILDCSGRKWLIKKYLFSVLDRAWYRLGHDPVLNKPYRYTSYILSYIPLGPLPFRCPCLSVCLPACLSACLSVYLSSFVGNTETLNFADSPFKCVTWIYQQSQGCAWRMLRSSRSASQPSGCQDQDGGCYIQQ